MKIAFFSAKSYEIDFFNSAAHPKDLHFSFFENPLNINTISTVQGFQGVCLFVNDRLDRPLLKALSEHKIRLVALRCAGFNQVDLAAAQEFGLTVVRVPEYSPYAVAEHTLALLLTLNRKTHRAYARVRENNFSLEGLMGFDLHQKTIGILGLGKIGRTFAQILQGFGVQLLGSDPFPSPEVDSLPIQIVSPEELFRRSDILSLHAPLNQQTYHCINEQTIHQMKPGMIILNTSRGALIDTKALIKGLKSKKIGGVGLDVYEEEADLFFSDHSGEILHDDLFARLVSFPNVLITGHQGFFTKEALTNIAQTTVDNILEFQQTGRCKNSVKP